MHYLPATPTHAPLLAAMNAHLIRDEGHSNRMTLPQLEHRMHTWLTTNEYQATLFTPTPHDLTDPIGYALYKRHPDHVYLRQFFIAAPHRRRGLGRQALTHLITQTFPPAPRLRLDVLSHNHAAIAFYRSLGLTDYCLTLECPLPASGEMTKPQ